MQRRHRAGRRWRAYAGRPCVDNRLRHCGGAGRRGPARRRRPRRRSRRCTPGRSRTRWRSRCRGAGGWRSRWRRRRWSAGGALAAMVKDAGDDPDVTHGALVRARVSLAAPATGVVFRAGPGVGTVTRPGLPLPPGEPAINPVPRAMILAALAEVRPAPDAVVEIGIPGGERAGVADAERAAGHRGRAVGAGDDGGGGAVFLRGVDRHDPPRGRRGAGDGAGARGGEHGQHVGGGGGGAAWAAGGGAAGDGGFRGGDAEVPAARIRCRG